MTNQGGMIAFGSHHRLLEQPQFLFTSQRCCWHLAATSLTNVFRLISTTVDATSFPDCDCLSNNGDASVVFRTAGNDAGGCKSRTNPTCLASDRCRSCLAKG